MNKLADKLSEIAIGIYVVLFGGIFVAALFFNNMFSYRVLLQAALILILIAVTCVFFFIYNKVSDILKKNKNVVLFIACIFMFIVFNIIKSQMVHEVVYDLEKTLNGAMTYALSGGGENFVRYRSYYYRYSFQVNIFLIQQFLFKIALKLGITDLYSVALFAGQIMYILGIVCTFRYLDENYNTDAAFFALYISLISIPMYFQTNIPYTDTYSLLGVPCILLFTTRALNRENHTNRIINSVIAGLTRGIFINLKSTVRIVLVALIIQSVVRKRSRDSVKVFTVIILLIFLTGKVYDTAADKIVFTEEVRKQESIPLTHWVMMGLQGDGSYNSDDEWGITIPTPPEERTARNIEVIKERLENMGVAGYIKLLYTKTCRSFGSGNLDIHGSYLYSKESEPINTLYNLVLIDGRYYNIFNNLSQAVYLFINAVSVIGAILVLRKKETGIFAHYITLIGFWMFMMLWESNQRQMVNQWLIYVTVAAIGMYQLYSVFSRRFSKVLSQKTDNTVI